MRISDWSSDVCSSDLFIACAGLGALPPEEAIYPMVPLDGAGKPLSGAARYVLHFDKDQIPPADAFWSLTMYGADQFFVANPIEIGRASCRERVCQYV